MSHDLLFSAHAQAIGAPELATPEQMADLADEPAFFRKRHKNKQPKPLPPVPLQSYQIEFDIPSKQFRAQAATRDSRAGQRRVRRRRLQCRRRAAQRQDRQRDLYDQRAAEVLPSNPAARRSHHRSLDIPGSPRCGHRKNWQRGILTAAGSGDSESDRHSLAKAPYQTRTLTGKIKSNRTAPYLRLN